MTFPKPVITREHGSWALIGVPMLIGASYAKNISTDVVIFAVSALCFFLSHAPLKNILRARGEPGRADERIRASVVWSAVYLLIGTAFGVPLILRGYFHLITFALLGAAAFLANIIITKKIQKSPGGDLIGVAGLTLGAPAAFYVATGSLEGPWALLWILNFLFFGSGVFYVHMKIKAGAGGKNPLSLKEKLLLGRGNIIYNIFAAAVVAALSFSGHAPPGSMIAFAPMLGHAALGTVRLGRRVRFRSLGMLLLMQSLFFGGMLVLA